MPFARLRVVLAVSLIAFGCLAEATKSELKDAESYYNRGNVSLDQSAFDQAIADYNEAIRLDPKLGAAYTNRGNAYLGKGDFDRAIADYNEAIQLDPNDAHALGNRANAYQHKGEQDRAIADYGAVLRVNPQDATAHNNRGNSYSSKGDFANAVTDYSEAIRLNPKPALFYSNRGNAYLKTGDCEKASADYGQAIGINPQSAEAYGAAAWLWATCADAKWRDGKRATDYATKACELGKSQSWYCLNTLAAAYAESGKLKEAVEWQKKALESPGLPEGELDGARRRLTLYQSGKPFHEPKSGR